jgi:elongation factor G
MAFKVAASLAYKTGLAQANPVLLEPVGKLEVHIPEANMGDIIGDINKRRGQVLGMNSDGEGLNVVEAEVPMAEMHSYLIDMRSITRGRGFFGFEFLRYQEAPPAVAQKVIESSKAEMTAEE